MPYNSKQIKISTNEKGKTLVKVGHFRTVESRIVFSFSFFNGKSIRINDFNNFYVNNSDAIKSVNDFFQAVKEISNFDINQFFSPAIKKQFHYNEFDDNKVIDRIEDILVNGYGMTRKMVDEFERMYFEFSFGNGRRVIGTKIYDNIFEILFIDCNHMVCLESSRNIKIKMKYNCPSIFGGIDKTITINEYNREELIDMLIDLARNNAYSNIEDFLKDYDELFASV